MATLKISVIGVRWFGKMHCSIIACVLALKLAAMEDGYAAKLSLSTEYTN